MKKKYDAILLLGVELDACDRPTPELRARALEAARRYAEGAAPMIVACGGTLPGHGVSEAQVMARLLGEAGVPEHAIIQENQSQDTAENIRFARRILGGGRPSVLVVTSDYHVRRAVMTARRFGFSAAGCGAALERDERWKTLRGKEMAYMVDLIMGWQDEGKSRPAWTYKLFDAVFGRK